MPTGGGVLVSRYNDGAGTFRGGAIYSRFISAVNYDALIFGVTSTGTKTHTLILTRPAWLF